MKRLLCIFLLITLVSHAQEIKKIKNIDLGILLHEIEDDYGLKIGKGNIIPIQLNKKQYDQRSKIGSNQLITKLIVESSAIFDQNLRKLKTHSVTRNGSTTINKFQYDSQGRLKKNWSEGARYGDTYVNYTYQKNGSFTRTQSFKDDGLGSKEICTKTNNGYIITGVNKDKIIVENNVIKKIYGYDKKEPVETLLKLNNSFKTIRIESSLVNTSFEYNKYQDVTLYKAVTKRNGDTTTKKYAYKYDKYGNWVISVMLLDLSNAKGVPSFPQPTLREIKYSNGEVTGTTDISRVEYDLVTLRKKLSNNNSSSSLLTWKKSLNENFRLYLDNKSVQKAQLAYMDTHLLVFIQDNNELYYLENAQNATLDKIFTAKQLSIETSFGYWFKKPNGSVTVFTKKGEIIQKSSLYKYAPNNIDVFYQGEGLNQKVVLENYKNAQIYTVYPAKDYNSYSGNKTITTTKKLSGTCLKGDCNNGYGEFKFSSNGKIAMGFFKNGAPYGPILIESSNIKDAVFSSYDGSFQKNNAFTYEYDGKNTIYFYDKNKTKGFSNNASKKETHELFFKNGKPVSKRLLKYNGDTGCMLGDCSNGIGVYKYNNNTVYFGTFKLGKRHGFGQLTFNNGTYYIGEFSYGQFNGLGSYTWSNDNHYFGEYKDGKYHGKGVMYYNKNRYDSGMWKDGNFVSRF